MEVILIALPVISLILVGVVSMAGEAALRRSRAGEAAPPVAPSPGRRRRFLLRLAAGVNLVLGALVCFFQFTDYSWAGRAADYVFPLAVALYGTVMLYVARRRAGAGKALLLTGFPSLLGGVLHSLALLFFLGYLLGGRVSQEDVSPDGRMVAEATYSYSTVHDHTYVLVKYPAFPFVERMVYFVPHNEGCWSGDSVRWQDDDTLCLASSCRPFLVSDCSGTNGVEIDVGVVGPPRPTFRAGEHPLITIPIVLGSAAGCLAAIYAPEVAGFLAGRRRSGTRK